MRRHFASIEAARALVFAQDNKLLGIGVNVDSLLVMRQPDIFVRRYRAARKQMVDARVAAQEMHDDVMKKGLHFRTVPDGS